MATFAFYYTSSARRAPDQVKTIVRLMARLEQNKHRMSTFVTVGNSSNLSVILCPVRASGYKGFSVVPNKIYGENFTDRLGRNRGHKTEGSLIATMICFRHVHRGNSSCESNVTLS